MQRTDKYSSPLSERYASKEMQYIFSQDMKFRTWRKLWIALAETEKELGLCQNGVPVITDEQIEELKAHAEDINYEVAKAREMMIHNLRKTGVPLNLLSQFMPIQYTKVREGVLVNDPEELIVDRIGNTVDEYLYATHQKELF